MNSQSCTAYYYGMIALHCWLGSSLSCICNILVVAVAEPFLNLTSSSTLKLEPFCPGPVVFTCNGTGISVVLNWKLNGNTISMYTFRTSHVFPQSLAVLSPSHQIDSVQVVSAAVQAGSNGLDIVSTLSVTDVSILNGTSLQCADQLLRESNVINVVVIARGKLTPFPYTENECFWVCIPV